MISVFASFLIVYIADVCLYCRCQDRHPQQWEEDSSGYGHQRTKCLSAKEETGRRWVKRRLLSVTSFRCHFLWDIHITNCLSAEFTVILRTHSNAEEYLDDEDSDWEKSSTNEVHSFLHSFQHKPLYVYKSKSVQETILTKVGRIATGCRCLIVSTFFFIPVHCKSIAVLVCSVHV